MPSGGILSRLGFGGGGASAKDKAGKEEKEGRSRKNKAVTGFIRGAFDRFGRESKNPHGLPLTPASSAEMSGWLYKQGYQVGGWGRRYFVLHGAVIAYYSDEASANDAEGVRSVGYVVGASKWPQGINAKPAQVRACHCHRYRTA